MKNTSLIKFHAYNLLISLRKIRAFQISPEKKMGEKTMANKLMIAGIPLLIIGILIFTLSTFQLVPLPLVVASTGDYQQNLQIPSGGTRDALVVRDVSHPLFVLVKVSFNLRSQSDIHCKVNLVYESTDGNTVQEIFQNPQYKDGDGDWDTFQTFSVSTQIGPSYAAKGFSLKLRIENTGDDPVTLGVTKGYFTFTLFASVFPAIFAIVGLALVIIGTVMSRKPAVAKPKPAPGGWEPTLQWGGGAAAGTQPTRKQPKMAIKSTKAPKKVTKKVIRKAAPAAGAQQACKFCGKPVSASAFFCPHCYGKLR